MQGKARLSAVLLVLLGSACATEQLDETSTRSPINANESMTADERTPKPEEVDDRGPVTPPQSGLIRPGGPVNTPVPGASAVEWSVLRDEDVLGAWAVETSAGFVFCEVLLEPATPTNVRSLEIKGPCPLVLDEVSYWRLFPELNQIALIGPNGGSKGSFQRSGHARFMIYDPAIGTLTLRRARD